LDEGREGVYVRLFERAPFSKNSRRGGRRREEELRRAIPMRARARTWSPRQASLARVIVSRAAARPWIVRGGKAIGFFVREGRGGTVKCSLTVSAVKEVVCETGEERDRSQTVNMAAARGGGPGHDEETRRIGGVGGGGPSVPAPSSVR